MFTLQVFLFYHQFLSTYISLWIISSLVFGNIPLLIGNVDPLYPDDTEEKSGLEESLTKGSIAISYDDIVIKLRSVKPDNISSKS